MTLAASSPSTPRRLRTKAKTSWQLRFQPASMRMLRSRWSGGAGRRVLRTGRNEAAAEHTRNGIEFIGNAQDLAHVGLRQDVAGKTRLVLFVDGFGNAFIFAVDEAYSLPMTPWSSVNSMTICVARSAFARSEARCNLASSRPRSSL